MLKPREKPYPLRLRELKAPLQMEAMQEDRSLHYLIKKILRDYLKKKKLV